MQNQENPIKPDPDKTQSIRRQINVLFNTNSPNAAELWRCTNTHDHKCFEKATVFIFSHYVCLFNKSQFFMRGKSQPATTHTYISFANLTNCEVSNWCLHIALWIAMKQILCIWSTTQQKNKSTTCTLLNREIVCILYTYILIHHHCCLTSVLHCSGWESSEMLLELIIWVCSKWASIKVMNDEFSYASRIIDICDGYNNNLY